MDNSTSTKATITYRRQARVQTIGASSLGIGGAVTGAVPVTGAGVLLLEYSGGLIVEGEGASKPGAFPSAVGSDFSGFGSDPLIALAKRIPFIGHSAKAVQAAINKGIEKAADPISEKLLGCKSGP